MRSTWRLKNFAKLLCWLKPNLAAIQLMGISVLASNRIAAYVTRASMIYLGVCPKSRLVARVSVLAEHPTIDA